jgi:four helix bundle protein
MDSSILKAQTKKFAVSVAKFCEDLRPTHSILVYTRQLIRSSSSVGANYRAACRAKSTADFINKLKIVEEEADESVYFLELIQELEPTHESKVTPLIKEGNEILAIIVASINTSLKRKAHSKI